MVRRSVKLYRSHRKDRLARFARQSRFVAARSSFILIFFVFVWLFLFTWFFLSPSSTDNFDIFGWNSYNNYYRVYSHTGKHHPRHYSYNFTDGNDRYSFVAADACVTPSPKRPYNFIGVLTKQDIRALKRLRDETIDLKSNFTIWFGHYPTSSIAMPNINIRHIIKWVLSLSSFLFVWIENCYMIQFVFCHIFSGPYMCGHFHTLSGLVKEMYSTHQEGSLELEVGDWKDNRIYRVAAIDHGIFSFIDTKLDQWPVILITNPKSSTFLMPGYEPLHRIQASSHIRVMIYTPFTLISAQFRVDNHTEWSNLTRVGQTNLFVHSWQPSLYAEGLHSIEVRASVNKRKNLFALTFLLTFFNFF